MRRKYYVCVVLLIGVLFFIGCDGNTIYPWDSEITKIEKTNY
jgi:hypothetical protein